MLTQKTLRYECANSNIASVAAEKTDGKSCGKFIKFQLNLHALIRVNLDFTTLASFHLEFVQIFFLLSEMYCVLGRDCLWSGWSTYCGQMHLHRSGHTCLSHKAR